MFVPVLAAALAVADVPVAVEDQGPLLIVDSEATAPESVSVHATVAQGRAWVTLHQRYGPLDAPTEAALELNLSESAVVQRLSIRMEDGRALDAHRQAPAPAGTGESGPDEHVGALPLGEALGVVEVELAYVIDVAPAGNLRELVLPIGTGEAASHWEAPFVEVSIEVEDGLPLGEAHLALDEGWVDSSPIGWRLQARGYAPKRNAPMSWSPDLGEPRAVAIRRGADVELVVESAPIAIEDPLGREIVVVVEREAGSIETAREAIRIVADDLGPLDSLEVVDIFTGARALSGRQAIDESALAKIDTWLEQDRSQNGYYGNYSGLSRAVSGKAKDDLRVVLLVSQGTQYPGGVSHYYWGYYGGAVSYEIDAVRFFALPTAEAADLHWLTALTQKGRGAVLSSPDELRTAFAGPILTDIELRPRVAGDRTPDLWTGRPLRVHRPAAGAGDWIEVTGQLGFDGPLTLKAPIVDAGPLPVVESDGPDLVLWADGRELLMDRGTDSPAASIAEAAVLQQSELLRALLGYHGGGVYGGGVYGGGGLGGIWE